MRLFIFRHGSAFPVSDKFNEENRLLTQKGHKETRKISHYLAKSNINFDIVLSSPYARALQTKENILTLQSKYEFNVLKELKPDENEDIALSKIKSFYKDDIVVGIIGHQPQLGKLLSKLFFVNQIIFEIIPATLLEIEIMKLEKSNYQCKLSRFMHPQHIL